MPNVNSACAEERKAHCGKVGAAARPAHALQPAVRQRKRSVPRGLLPACAQ